MIVVNALKVGFVLFAVGLAGCGAAPEGEESVSESQQAITGGFTYGGSFLIDDCNANNVVNPYTNGLNCPAGYTASQSSRQLDPESGCGGKEYSCRKSVSGFWF